MYPKSHPFKASSFLPLFLASILGLLSFMGLTKADADVSYSPTTQPTIINSISRSEAAISTVLVTPLSTTGRPGDLIQLVAAIRREGADTKENITSCFPCPTTNNSSNGTVTYEIVKGPATIQWSKILINPDAQIGDEIVFRAHYEDNVSGSSAISHYNKITVTNAKTPEVDLSEGEMDELWNQPEGEADEMGNEELKPAAEEYLDDMTESDNGIKMIEKTATEIDQVTQVNEGSDVEPVRESDKTPDTEMNAQSTQHDNGDADNKNMVYWTILALILLAIAAMVAKRRMGKIDHIAPEHRAKENELYEAFGEKHHDHSAPENHDEKKREVEEAFGKLEK